MVELLDPAESSELERMEADSVARQQRISRYKEQRRRQLAAQYGAHDASSPTPGGGVSVRSTRASRLRSAAATATANGNSSDSPGNKGVDGVRRSSACERKDINGRLGPSPQDTKENSPQLSDSSSTPRRERDKSAKRKSYLNRSLNNEPVADASRRRRSLVLSSPGPRSPPVTAPTSAPETDSPRHNSARNKRTTPPRESPRHRPRSSSTVVEPPAAADLPDVVVLPSSILKKKSVDETSSQTVTSTAGKPVSILKRKTSQEEGSSAMTQPVTFSPSVIEPSSSRRQGILKKHRSLDDGSGVMMRRSASPDKPILKHQRRSSLEEVRRRRTQSPEPTSILKRKTSREEAEECSSVSEPQGILKRKTSGSPGPVHVTIADSVILAVAGEDSLADDHVRPILKKKTSVGEEPQCQDTPAPVSSETPKPILKKKSSSETEEGEDKPKPILKSRSSSRVSEGRSSFTGLETLLNGTEEPVAEPSVLSVRAESSPERSVVRRMSRTDPDTSVKRRSLDSWVRFREESERTTEQTTRTRASCSVAEMIMNMESVLANEASQRPRSLSPGVEGQGALPRRTRDGERWRTQPITVQELSWTRTESDMPRNDPDKDKDSKREEEEGHTLTRSNSVSARASMFETLRQQREDTQNKLPKGSSSRRVRLDPSRFQTQPVTQDEVEEAKRVNEASKSATAEDDDPNDPSKLSLAERVRLFNEKTVNCRFNPRSQRHKTQPITPEELETAQKLTPMARSASSVLVSGILKNLSEKNLGPKPKPSQESDEDSESVKEPSSPLKRGILKSPSRIPKPDVVEDSETSCLRSVLKKENKISEPDRRSKDLHSILKVSKDKESSSSEETETDSEDDKPNANSDLIDLLHKVEAQARGERKANESPEKRKSLILNNNNKPDESDKMMNMKNLDQGKENYDVTRRIRRKKDCGELSGEDSSSSGGREVRKIIGNEAVARRRQAGLAKEAAERAKRTSGSEGLSKSRSHSAMNGEVVLRPPSGVTEALPLRRCRTQPMDECDEPLTNRASITQRLEALQKRGQTDWKKRISRLNPGEELPSTISINAAAQVLVERVSSPSPPAAVPPPVSSSLPHTLSLLQEASEGWKRRVNPSDATKFSVAGKMGPVSPMLSPLLSPNMERKKVKPERFRSKGPGPKDAQSVPTSPDAEVSAPSTPAAFKRSVSAPGEEDKTLSSEGPLVTVPKAFDEDFTNFFTSSAVVTSERIQLRDEDLETVSRTTSQLLVSRKQVKVQRRRVASSNPVKALAARTDLRDTYVEVKTGVASREEQRLRVEKLAKNSTLAVEALAGLASKEDFAGVQLRSTAQTTASVHTGPWLAYADLMLLQVKGRRHVQTRLVRPHYTSVNQGDSYVLVTPTQVFQWNGQYSNVIEKSRSSEIASLIARTRDLGCSAANVTVVQSSQPNKQFWQLLGADDDIAANYKGAEAGHPDEDELYELAVNDTNKIYELEGDELVPREDCWANIPRIEILSHNKVLVFDFGAELYVWMGKSVSLDRRPTVLKLAQELWNHGFDYSECDICPITQAELLGTRTGKDKADVEKSAAKRPDWCLLAKVTQHRETVLFREKFLDWPDFSRVIQVKNRDKDKQVDGPVELKPCDAREMVDWSPLEPDLQLEGSHLGRGHKYYDVETHRHYEIATLGVKVWHVQEFDSTELQDSLGQLHSGDSYVVRWHYSVTVSGRELTGQPSRHSTMGRDRVMYWTWHGSDASINDSGAAALLTVELDQERGPQQTIKQGAEPPAFRRLFNSGLTIHRGRRCDSDDRTDRWRLYIVLGEETAEAMLLEVPLHCRQLRSRGCLVLLDTEDDKAFIWRGAHALDHTHKVAVAAVERLKEQLPSETGLTEVEELEVEEISEGKEPKLFFDALGGHNRQMYHSLLSVPASQAPTTRMFLLTGVSGALTVCPVTPVCGHSQLASPFPYTQETLYDARQPALFLVDTGACVWLWQGWVSEAQAEAEVGVRWQSERRAAMATTLEYHKLRHSGANLATPPPRLVWAGLEPLEFTNLFPTWECHDVVTEINITDGHAGELVPVEAELERLTQSTFPPSQLLQRPLPDGVDPTRLEDYLAPQHFQEVLGLSKEEFSELPAWKQNKLKQEKGLF
ncbi:supervillin isoform X2 [Macrosteles quadrilineatus]|uniref:supervillin isoform X2 n=1 Tax=Macrosteles quadrilineatus TaxID=74068 RepID=UPI0023E0B39F|nr:supervillin isoform X2 [Macrosteles quadrilineatus]